MSERKLRPREASFVQEYLKHGVASVAAVAAGYAKSNAKNAGWRLLHKNEAIAAAISDARKSLVEKGQYNLEKAMIEAEEAMKFARETENANAFTKAVELRSKLNGLLVEKHDVRQVGFQIQISGIDFPKKIEEEDIFS